MSKKIYDLSAQTMMAGEQRILKAESGKEYNVSFRPAILNRKFYKRWKESQAEIIAYIPEFVKSQRQLKEGKVLDEVQMKAIKDFTAQATDAAKVGAELLIYAIKANGYEEFTEDELYTNFSESGLSFAIDFVMGIDKVEETKKKVTRKRKR